MEAELQAPTIPSCEKKHTEYIGLYQHYSGIIFKARASIVSGIVLFLGYILGIIPNGNHTPLVNAIIPLCAALFVPGIFMVEVAYSKRFFEIIYFLQKMEGGTFLFSNYKRVHWQFSVLYFYAIIVFNVICYMRVSSHYDVIKTPQVILIYTGMLASVVSMRGIYWDLDHSYHHYFNNAETKPSVLHLLVPSFVILWFSRMKKK